MPNAWILPQNGKSTLWVRPDATHYRDASRPIIDKGPMAMPPRAVHWLDIEQDRLVYADGGKLHLCQGLSGQTKPRVIKLPGKPQIHALHVVDDVLFTGADAGKGMLGYWDLRASGEWTAIDVPSEVNWTGKGVDGFAVHGSKLIAIDDIVLPRYLLVLDIAHPRHPKWLEHRDLPAHSSYERIRSVASNDEIAVMLSSSANHGASALHIGFLHLATLEEYAVLSVQGRPSFRKWADRSYDFHAIALQGERLLIAAGSDGLGILELPRYAPREPEPDPKRRTILSRAEHLSEETLRFLPVTAGDVVGVSAVDDTQAFVIVQKGLLELNRIESILIPLTQR